MTHRTMWRFTSRLVLMGDLRLSRNSSHSPTLRCSSPAVTLSGGHVAFLQRFARIGSRLFVIALSFGLSLVVGLTPAGATQQQPPVILTPTVNGTVTGWL